MHREMSLVMGDSFKKPYAVPPSNTAHLRPKTSLYSTLQALQAGIAQMAGNRFPDINKNLPWHYLSPTQQSFELANHQFRSKSFEHRRPGFGHFSSFKENNRLQQCDKDQENPSQNPPSSTDGSKRKCKENESSNNSRLVTGEVNDHSGLVSSAATMLVSDCTSTVSTCENYLGRIKEEGRQNNFHMKGACNADSSFISNCSSQVECSKGGQEKIKLLNSLRASYKETLHSSRNFCNSTEMRKGLDNLHNNNILNCSGLVPFTWTAGCDEVSLGFHPLFQADQRKAWPEYIWHGFFHRAYPVENLVDAGQASCSADYFVPCQASSNLNSLCKISEEMRTLNRSMLYGNMLSECRHTNAKHWKMHNDVPYCIDPCTTQGSAPMQEICENFQKGRRTDIDADQSVANVVERLSFSTTNDFKKRTRSGLAKNDCCQLQDSSQHSPVSPTLSESMLSSTSSGEKNKLNDRIEKEGYCQNICGENSLGKNEFFSSSLNQKSHIHVGVCKITPLYNSASQVKKRKLTPFTVQSIIGKN